MTDRELVIDALRAADGQTPMTVMRVLVRAAAGFLEADDRAFRGISDDLKCDPSIGGIQTAIVQLKQQARQHWVLDTTAQRVQATAKRLRARKGKR